jgi:hypothetical protein
MQESVKITASIRKTNILKGIVKILGFCSVFAWTVIFPFPSTCIAVTCRQPHLSRCYSLNTNKTYRSERESFIAKH